MNKSIIFLSFLVSLLTFVSQVASKPTKRKYDEM